jgi:hypothetical protein
MKVLNSRSVSARQGPRGNDEKSVPPRDIEKDSSSGRDMEFSR